MITKCGHRYFNDTDGDVWEDEPKPTYTCECCGKGIFANDDYFELDGNYYCYSCAYNRCENILAAFGAEDKEIVLPKCEYCGDEITGRYKIFRGKKYCEDCIADCGADLIEEVFGIKPETAGEPEEQWGNPWEDRWED